MVAEDFLQDPQVRQWLGGVEPAWRLLTFESLRALRQEPSAVQTAIRIANDLGADEIAGSPVARNPPAHPGPHRGLPAPPTWPPRECVRLQNALFCCGALVRYWHCLEGPESTD